MKTQTPMPSEWTPEADAQWKDPGWWEQGQPKDHLALDDLFHKHIMEDFQAGPWTEPIMNQEAYFVSSAGGLRRRVVLGYDYTEDTYFMCDTAKNIEVKVKPERIWATPEGAIIHKLREVSLNMINMHTSPDPAGEDSRRKPHRRMLRFILQQLESL